MSTMLVTVSTDNVALLNLFHGLFNAVLLKNTINVIYFLMLWSVIELEHVVGEAIATVSTALIFFELSYFR